VKTAGLFAANPSAIKTYESLGFVQSGQFRLNLIREDFRYNPFVL
jgi:predicted GNAT family acetyltransferase